MYTYPPAGAPASHMLDVQDSGLAGRKRPKPGIGNEKREPLERLLTVDQLAGLWQVSPRTIRRMIADGRLPVIRLGRAIRIAAKVAAR
jgi:excisionase family DNA binding protein